MLLGALPFDTPFSKMDSKFDLMEHKRTSIDAL